MSAAAVDEALVEKGVLAICPPHHREGWASQITDAAGRVTSKAGPRRPCAMHIAETRVILAAVLPDIRRAAGEEIAQRIEALVPNEWWSPDVRNGYGEACADAARIARDTAHPRSP